MFNGLQPWHLIIVVVVAVLLFGAKRLPDAARSVGKSMKIFKAETKDLKSDGKADSTGEVETRALPAAKSDTDQRVEELQRQLDELKGQQTRPSDHTNKNTN